MGNDQYYFTVYNTAEAQDELLSNFNLAISASRSRSGPATPTASTASAAAGTT